MLRSALEATRAAAVAIVATCEQPDTTEPTDRGTAGPDDPVARGAENAALFRQRLAQLEEEG